MPIIQPGPASPQHYSTRQLVEQLAGTYNADLFADIANTGDSNLIATRFEAALTWADRRIGTRAAQLRAPVPDPTSPFYPELQNFATVYAVTWLYRGRGQSNENNSLAGIFKQEMDDADCRLTGVLVANREQVGVTGVYVQAPAVTEGCNPEERHYEPIRTISGWPYRPWPW